jgi:hypothetical protein
VTRWRAYYNSHAEAPLFWSIDQNTTRTEIKVRAIVIDGAVAVSRVSVSRDNVIEPRAWLEVEGTLDISGDLAIFRA